MENEKELYKKIQEYLQKHFHVSTRIYDLKDDSFRYELFEDGKINLYQVKFTNDQAGLNIDWGNAWIVKPPNFNHPVGEAKLDI